MTSTRFSLPFLLLLEMVLVVNWAGAQVPVPADPLPPQVPPSSSNYAYQNQTPTSQPTPGYNYSTAPNNGNQRFNNPENPSRQGLGGGAGAGAGRAGIMRMVQQLGLTDDQRQQIMQIIRNTADRQERRQQIVALLTPEQRQRLRGMMREMMQRRQGEQGGQGGQGQQQGGGVPPMNPNPGDAQPEAQTPTNSNGNGPRFTPYDPKPVQPLNL